MINWMKQLYRNLTFAANQAITIFPTHKSTASVVVNDRNALGSTAVLSCVRVLQESLATCPIILYEQAPDGRKRAVSHPLYKVLHNRPNPYQTPFIFKQVMLNRMLLKGAAYAFIESDSYGRITALYPILADVRPLVYPDRVDYEVHFTGGTKIFRQWEVMPWMIFTRDGINGLSVIDLAKDAIGLSIAEHQYAAKFFANGATPDGYLSFPNQLSDDTKTNVARGWNQNYQGVHKAHKTAVLDEGVKYVPISVNPTDAQLLASYQFSITDIARIFRVPPHLIADLTRSTYSNIEQQGIEFVKYTLLPYTEMICQEINRSLLLEVEQDRYYAEFLVDKFLQGDQAARYEAFKTGILSGFVTPNEVRRLENLPPVEGGDTLFIPLNMVPIDQTAQAKENDVTAGANQPTQTQLNSSQGAETRARHGAATRLKLRKRYQPLFKDAFTRVLKRELSDLRRQAEKHLTHRASAGDFNEYVTKIYDALPGYMRSTLKPVLRSYMESIAEAAAGEVGTDLNALAFNPDDATDKFLDVLILRYISSHQNQLKRLMNDTEVNALFDVLSQRWDEWEDKPDEYAENEANRAEGYAAKSLWLIAGVTKLVWQSNANCCPICAEMDGRVVGIEKSFLTEGDTVSAAGAADLTTQSDIHGPPLHKGCSCSISASV